MGTGSREHLTDDELVRLLDDEVTAAERAEWNDHMRACAACTQQLDELSEASSWFRSNVVLLDGERGSDDLARARARSALRAAMRDEAPAPTGAEVPVARRFPQPAHTGRTDRRWHLRAAAVIGTLLLGSLTVEPVRAWISNGVGRLTGRSEAPAEVVEIAAAPVAAPGAVARFQPVGSVFRVEMASGQSVGKVTVEFTAATQAAAQIMDGAGETFVVMPAGLRVENSSTSAASYRIELPAGSVQRVEIVAGGAVLESRGITPQAGVIEVNLAEATETP